MPPWTERSALGSVVVNPSVSAAEHDSAVFGNLGFLLGVIPANEYVGIAIVMLARVYYYVRIHLGEGLDHFALGKAR